MQEQNQIIEEIKEAIKLERKDKANRDRCIVLYKEIFRDYCRLTIESVDEIGEIRIEEYNNAWWEDRQKQKQTAIIYQQFSTSRYITIAKHFFDKIDKGESILLYRPDFLLQLSNHWSDEKLASLACESISDLKSPTHFSSSLPSLKLVPKLRSAQQKSFDLIKYSSAFLWGPPGTGKTTTLGVLISEYLQTFETSRVLMLSNTHSAIDGVALRVDKELGYASQHRLRTRIYRQGEGWNQRTYIDENCLHLVLDLDSETKDRLIDLFKYTGNNKLNREKYNKILNDDALLNRKKLDKSINDRLLCMTTNSALANLSKLIESGPFDLIVFDESSQIGIPQTLMLMPLGKVRIFGGDPNQLPPVAKCKDAIVKKWIGNSVFEFMPKDSAWVCQLDEQSRMAPKICELVSKTFYDGKLKVAANVSRNLDWHREIYIPYDGIGRNYQVAVEKVPDDDVEDEFDDGYSRKSSAYLIADIIYRSIMEFKFTIKYRVLIITPFRAQRKLISNILLERGLGLVRVSTIHASQGSEADIVFFDPVNGGSPFLTDKAARNIINVALSRAKYKLIMLFSESDLRNPLLDQINQFAEDYKNRKPKYLSDVFFAPDWRTSAFGQRVGFRGRIVDIVDVGIFVKYIDVADNTVGKTPLLGILDEARKV